MRSSSSDQTSVECTETVESSEASWGGAEGEAVDDGGLVCLKDVGGVGRNGEVSSSSEEGLTSAWKI